jgi:hypothetical protein
MPKPSRLERAHARAEEIATEMVRNIEMGIVNLDTVQSPGLSELYNLVIDRSRGQSQEEEREIELCATEDAAWLLGVAVGRRLGGAR